MSTTGEMMVRGIMGAYCMSGIDVDKIDFESQTLYLAIPKDSYEYHMGTVIMNAQSYAKRIKETWKDLGIFPECKVRYREKDIFWTKEMSDRNYELHKCEIHRCTLWNRVIALKNDER